MDKPMRDFIRLVSDMRSAQKEYFRTRDKTVLQNSKMLEKSVDAMLATLKQGYLQQQIYIMEQHGDNNLMLDTLHGDVVIR